MRFLREGVQGPWQGRAGQCSALPTSKTWGWIADMQQINSLDCPFACAMFVERRDVYTGLVPTGLLSLGKS